MRTLDNGLVSEQPSSSTRVTLWAILAVSAGALLGAVVLPLWQPAVTTQFNVYWYISRSSAFVAYVLIWVSMALGVGITNKMVRVWPGGPTGFDLHEYTSLLGLGFALVHALVLLGDRFIGFSLSDIFLPFMSANYRPLWVGLGQISLYGLVVVTISFYMRQKIGNRAWRVIHYFSYSFFALALLHGLTSGTDTGDSWVLTIYWVTSGSLLFLTIYRMLAPRMAQA